MDYNGEELLDNISIKYVSAEEWIEEKLKEYGLSLAPG